MIFTSFFRWEKVTVVQLNSSGDNQPFSSLQWRIAVPEKKSIHKKENEEQIQKFVVKDRRRIFYPVLCTQATITKLNLHYTHNCYDTHFQTVI